MNNKTMDDYSEAINNLREVALSVSNRKRDEKYKDFYFKLMLDEVIDRTPVPARLTEMRLEAQLGNLLSTMGVVPLSQDSSNINF